MKKYKMYNIIFMITIGCLALITNSCSTYLPSIYNFRFEKPYINNELELCRIYEREMIIAVDQLGSLRSSERSVISVLSYIFTYGEVPVSRNIVFEVPDSCNVLSQLYENSHFEVINVSSNRWNPTCDTMKRFEKHNTKSVLPLLMNRDLPCAFRSMTKNTSSICDSNLLIIPDKKFGEYKKSIAKEVMESQLELVSKEDTINHKKLEILKYIVHHYYYGEFLGHVYRTYKVKMRYTYAGKENYFIPNFGMRHDVGHSWLQKCNRYMILEIKSIEPISLKNRVFYPE